MKYQKKYYTLLGVLLLITVIGLTYAFFAPQAGGTTINNAIVTSNTTDLLTFSIDQDISFTVTQANFAENGTNQSGDATATATLTPNNKTGSATMNYYLYLRLDSNPIVYSEANINHDPELMLQVFDGNNQLVTLTEFGTQKTIKGVTGYDITGLRDVKALLDNHAINASNNQTTIETWRVVITMINLDVNQNENTGKEISGRIIIQKDDLNYCEKNPFELACQLDLDFNPTTTNAITLANGYLYHHDNTLENGANDGSYRYAGANPNNYVCFGSDAQTCPDENIYRIIGLIPVDVVIDDNDPNNIITERQMLYKLIRNDYETETSLGVTISGGVSFDSPYRGPAGNRPSYSVNGFYWMKLGNLGSYSNSYSAWGRSALNTIALNTNALNSLGSWGNKIANVTWKVGGNTSNNISRATPMSTVYTNEITNSGVNVNNEENFYSSSDGKTEIFNKLGLMYVSDYGYAAPQSEWIRPLGSDDSNNDYRNYTTIANNWLYRGVMEWTITRSASIQEYSHNYNAAGSINFIYNNGGVFSSNASGAYGVRRVFYLKKDIEIDMDNYAGTLTEPYRII